MAAWRDHWGVRKVNWWCDGGGGLVVSLEGRMVGRSLDGPFRRSLTKEGRVRDGRAAKAGEIKMLKKRYFLLRGKNLHVFAC